jgi:PEGA domain
MTFRKASIALVMGMAVITGAVMVPRADAASRVIVRPAFGFYSGPSFYYRRWRPAYVYPIAPRGDVKIETSVKGESIYVDGGYAGLTGKLKKFSLSPGNHFIEVRDPSGRDVFENTVRVLNGRTVEIHC